MARDLCNFKHIHNITSIQGKWNRIDLQNAGFVIGIDEEKTVSLVKSFRCDSPISAVRFFTSSPGSGNQLQPLLWTVKGVLSWKEQVLWCFHGSVRWICSALLTRTGWDVTFLTVTRETLTRVTASWRKRRALILSDCRLRARPLWVYAAVMFSANVAWKYSITGRRGKVSRDCSWDFYKSEVNRRRKHKQKCKTEKLSPDLKKYRDPCVHFQHFWLLFKDTEMCLHYLYHLTLIPTLQVCITYMPWNCDLWPLLRVIPLLLSF